MLASAIILSCSFVANIGIVNIYRNQLFSEAEKRALLLAESTAIFFTNTLLYEKLNFAGNGVLFENYINDLLAGSMTSAIGVVVYDTTGTVLASDNHGHFFTSVDSKTLVQWSNIIRAEIIDNGHKTLFAVFFPLQIESKRFGMLQMQFSRVWEVRQVETFKKLMFMVSLGFAVVGILLAIFVARTLAKPIKRLAGEMGLVEYPAYSSAITVDRRDEIADLQRRFVEMLTRLRTTAEEKDGQHKALIQAEKMASIGTLVSGLAHEINNPLAGIRNCLRRIITHPEDSLQTTKYAKLMDNALLRIETIVKDLLNFSRKKDLLLRPVKVNESIASACSLVDLRAQKHQVELSIELSEDLPLILGDPQRLEQVFLNLLLNAVVAVGEDGRITVRSEVMNSQVIVEVADNGPGIAPEIQHKIFDPFFTTKPVGEGTGLGLSVTKAMVEEINGRIEVRSNAGGTVFHLSFPVAVAHHSATKNSHQVAAAILAGGKSKRMRQNKALMQFAGKPMIEYVAEGIRSQVQEVMVISNQIHTYGFLKLPVYPDAIASCGPLAGIFTALHHSEQPHCLVVACDLPFLSQQLIQFLCENCAPYDVLVFESESGVEPLCGIYSKTCLPIIETQIQNGKYKVSDFFDRVKARIVRLEPSLAFYDKSAFFNINTPEEMKLALGLSKKKMSKVRKQEK